MNERIKELAEQARELVRKQMLLFQEADMSQRDVKWAELYNTKFAELIVRECIKTLEFHGFDEAVPYIQWMATNKFGVEE